MILDWPAILPRPERDSWQRTSQDARRKRQSEAGPPGYRRRFSSAAKMVTLSLILTADQRARFDRFHADDCAQGTRLFYMPDPTMDGWPLLASDGQPLLTGAGAPLLIAARWLCSWGDQPPAETVVQQVKFRKAFSIVVMP